MQCLVCKCFYSLLFLEWVSKSLKFCKFAKGASDRNSPTVTLAAHVVLLVLYFTYLRPHLICAIPCWSCRYELLNFFVARGAERDVVVRSKRRAQMALQSKVHYYVTNQCGYITNILLWLWHDHYSCPLSVAHHTHIGMHALWTVYIIVLPSCQKLLYIFQCHFPYNMPSELKYSVWYVTEKKLYHDVQL